MAKRGEAKELFTASEVARFCQVDLKTIHNWADRGEIRHFRTPGRHLRFRRVDVLDFLRKYGYPVPEVLRQGKPSVHLIDENRDGIAELEGALGDRFEVTSFSEPVDALIAVGRDTPDVVVLDLTGEKLDGMSCIERLQSMEATRHVRIVVYSQQEHASQRALDAGASAFVRRPDPQRLVDTLEALMGTVR
ncbi:MAG: helix-turn-helix domain-containing protein [Myxococcales bacterium]|nr:helix-turn-helix domain-containing protein [Myxococcales bacterium]MDD9967646.1 helix-turn-helix domain-containing protein [Myxococcales bacterium]